MQYMVQGATATRSPSVADVKMKRGLQREIIQVDISGTATVKIYARISDSMDWVQVGDDFTASGFVEVAYIHEWKADISAYTSGTVDVAITGEAA